VQRLLLRDQAQGAYPYWFLREVTVQTNDATSGRCCEKSDDDIVEFEFHGCPLWSGKNVRCAHVERSFVYVLLGLSIVARKRGPQP
jgi:hypothetical protein